MEKKIDKRLAEALKKGFDKKIGDQRKASEEARAEKEAHEQELKKHIPKARAWIKEHLFELIAEKEAQGSTKLSLIKHVEGIPVEVIYGLVKNIQGLHAEYAEKVTWDDPDTGQIRDWVCTITWQSVNPNLNRNDR